MQVTAGATDANRGAEALVAEPVGLHTATMHTAADGNNAGPASAGSKSASTITPAYDGIRAKTLVLRVVFNETNVH